MIITTKNNRGITLLSLMISIIVLLIIGSVTIATVLGDHKLIDRADLAKNQTELSDSIEKNMVDDAYGYTNVVGGGSITDHNWIGNDPDYIVGGTVQPDEPATQCTHSWDSGVISKEVTCTENGLKTDTCTLCGATQTTFIEPMGHNYESVVTLEPTSTTEGLKKHTCKNCGDTYNEVVPILVDYLVDKVQIGDYVDIGISYTNPDTPNTLYLSGTDLTLTGWRVLTTSGSGASGTVTLVSAGAPLRFYHPSGGVSQSSIDDYLSNLNTTIAVDESSTHGYRVNGFSSSDLASIWSSNSNIDGATAHAMTIDEVMDAYAALTGTSKTMSDLYNMNWPLLTSKMITVNSSISTKSYNLLGIGITYWLGGSQHSINYLWNVEYDGDVYGYYGASFGVRPVVSLKSGVQIARDNTGTGGYDSAYKLAE